MPLWNKVWMVAVLSLVMTTGCSGDDTKDDDPAKETCASTRDCATSEVCDPTSKVCVPKCTADQHCDTGQRCFVTRGECVDVSALVCTGDADCLEAELCHPTAKVCVQVCTSAADCPASAKTCAPAGTTDNRQICQCSTNELCNMDRVEADLVCSTLDRVCVPQCSSDAHCGTGRRCDTATGQCRRS